MEKDFIEELGYLAFATRIKRLSDNLMQDGRRMYQNLDIDIEPNWFLIFKLLQKYKSLSITDIAQHLRLAHPSIISITNKMEKAGYLVSVKSEQDSRKRVLNLSKKAIKRLPEYEEIWRAGILSVQEAMADLNILEVLSKVEESFNHKGFRDRTLNTLEELKNQEVNIIDFKSEYASDFTQINFQWLERYFYIEEYDNEVLTQPEKYILEPGGHILFAQFGEKIVGTVALIVREEGTFELSKMGVLEGYRGLKIGDQLMRAALEYCKRAGKKRVMLDSNRKLAPALSLYEKFGFKEIPVDPETPYERCNIRMELWL